MQSYRNRGIRDDRDRGKLLGLPLDTVKLLGLYHPDIRLGNRVIWNHVGSVARMKCRKVQRGEFSPDRPADSTAPPDASAP